MVGDRSRKFYAHPERLTKNQRPQATRKRSVLIETIVSEKQVNVK